MTFPLFYEYKITSIQRKNSQRDMIKTYSRAFIKTSLLIFCSTDYTVIYVYIYIYIGGKRMNKHKYMALDKECIPEDMWEKFTHTEMMYKILVTGHLCTQSYLYLAMEMTEPNIILIWVSLTRCCVCYLIFQGRAHFAWNIKNVW